MKLRIRHTFLKVLKEFLATIIAGSYKIFTNADGRNSRITTAFMGKIELFMYDAKFRRKYLGREMTN